MIMFRGITNNMDQELWTSTMSHPRYSPACASPWFDIQIGPLHVLKVWRHIKNPTLSIEPYLLEEQSRQISPTSDLKRQSLFEERPSSLRRTRWYEISSWSKNTLAVLSWAVLGLESGWSKAPLDLASPFFSPSFPRAFLSPFIYLPIARGPYCSHKCSYGSRWTLSMCIVLFILVVCVCVICVITLVVSIIRGGQVPYIFYIFYCYIGNKQCAYECVRV